LIDLSTMALAQYMPMFRRKKYLNWMEGDSKWVLTALIG
jgi:hypothetical protein